MSRRSSPQSSAGEDLETLATSVYEGDEARRAQQRARQARAELNSPRVVVDEEAFAVTGKRSSSSKRRGQPAPEAGRNPAGARSRGAPRKARHQGRLVLFFSTHGGTGTSTLVATLAGALASRGIATGILDLDLQFGDALNVLNLKATCPISELMAGRSTIDVDELRQRLPQHESGVAVLSQVGFVEDLAQVKKKRFGDFVDRVKGCFEVLLVDGVRDFNDFAVSALDLADELIVVTTQDVLALRGLAMRLEVLTRLGIRPADFVVVLNRYSSGRLPLTAIVESLHVEPRFVIREDAKVVEGALKEGRTVIEHAPRSRVAKEIGLLAQSLVAVSQGGGADDLPGGRR